MITRYLEYWGRNAGFQKVEEKEIFWIGVSSAAFAISWSAN